MTLREGEIRKVRERTGVTEWYRGAREWKNKGLSQTAASVNWFIVLQVHWNFPWMEDRLSHWYLCIEDDETLRCRRTAWRRKTQSKCITSTSSFISIPLTEIRIHWVRHGWVSHDNQNNNNNTPTNATDRTFGALHFYDTNSYRHKTKCLCALVRTQTTICPSKNSWKRF